MLGVVLKKREPPNPSPTLLVELSDFKGVSHGHHLLPKALFDRCKVLEVSKTPLNLCSWPSRPECIYQSSGFFVCGGF